MSGSAARSGGRLRRGAAEAGHAGLSQHGALSPFGEWIAYGGDEGNPDNESGLVIVVSADGSALPTPVATVKQSYPTVLGWVDK